MKNYNVLLAFSLIFGVAALVLWTLFWIVRDYIPIIYPIGFNILQFVFIVLMRKRDNK
jgi:hypothetical protein